MLSHHHLLGFEVSVLLLTEVHTAGVIASQRRYWSWCLFCPPWLISTGKWKPNDYPFVDNVRAIYLTLEKLIQPEETQVNGIVILADYTGVGMSQASNPGPFLAKKVVSILQVRTIVSDDSLTHIYIYHGYGKDSDPFKFPTLWLTILTMPITA